MSKKPLAGLTISEAARRVLQASTSPLSAKEVIQAMFVGGWRSPKHKVYSRAAEMCVRVAMGSNKAVFWQPGRAVWALVANINKE